MRRGLTYAMTCLALVGLLAACATKPPPEEPGPAVTEVSAAAPSSIQAEATGLAPSGNARFQTISFSMLFGNPEAVSSWTVSIMDQKSKAVIRTISGKGADLPERLSWDGKTAQGALAPEGLYVAGLAVDYTGKHKAGSATSKPFLLDISPPTASFSPNPATFAYAPDGVLWPINVAVGAKPGFAKAVSWTMEVFSSGGSLLKSFEGSLPAAQVAWDGKVASGAYLEAGKSYPTVLKVLDEYGNPGTFKGSFAVASMPGAENSSITLKRGGFSPKSKGIKNTLDLMLAFGSKASVNSWKVTILSPSRGAVKTFAGIKDQTPEFVQWDGKDDAGALAAEGSYYAVFDLEYGKLFKPSSVQSRAFSLVVTPPAGSVTVDPPSVSLADLGPKKPVTFTVQAKSSFAQLATWTMTVNDPSGRALAVFNANWPNNKVQWDGVTVDGGQLSPGTNYSVHAKVQDEYGNIGDLVGTLGVDSLASATEPSYIRAMSSGLAPKGDMSFGTMAFSLSAGNKAALRGWKVSIVGKDGNPVRQFTGGKTLPATLIWDSLTDEKIIAPEGLYQAVLTLDYGVLFSPVTVQTDLFTLDINPPTGTIALSTELFSPDGDGVDDTISISLTARSGMARITGWSMTIYDPGNNAFLTRKGEWPAQPIVWDGIGMHGDSVESASEYPVMVSLRDEFGNIGEAKSVIKTDILVMKVSDGYRIRVPSIVFKPFTADFQNVAPDIAAHNLKTLDLLASRLAKFPDYRIKLEGHAVMINWDDKAKGEAEQEHVLLPLSTSRAESIKAALVARGLAPETIVTEGVGARDPLVPDSDYANRWKNRRVEFYLLK